MTDQGSRIAKLVSERAELRAENKELHAQLRAAHERIHGLQAALKTAGRMYARARTKFAVDDFCEVHGGSRGRCGCGTPPGCPQTP